MTAKVTVKGIDRLSKKLRKRLEGVENDKAFNKSARTSINTGWKKSLERPQKIISDSWAKDRERLIRDGQHVSKYYVGGKFSNITFSGDLTSKGLKTKALGNARFELYATDEEHKGYKGKPNTKGTTYLDIVRNLQAKGYKIFFINDDQRGKLVDKIKRLLKNYISKN